MAGKNKKRWGQQDYPVDHDFSQEILTSLPGLHRHTSQLAPDQVPGEPFEEIRTGQDNDKKSASVQHTILGLLTWMGLIGWTIHIWIAAPMAISDLILAVSLWVLTFLFTIVGVPAVRRKARNRAKHD